MVKGNKCDEKTILTLLDVFGSCITDIFYNHLYDRAIAIRERSASQSLTVCYRNVISEYLQESNTSKFYTMLFNSLHHYIRMSTVYSDISYSDCISLFVGMYVPHMYITSLTAEQKINILSNIMKKSISSFAVEILEEHISCIIDDHGDHTNIEVLQDSILKILLQERDRSYTTFVQSQQSSSKKETGKERNGVTSDVQTQTQAPPASTQTLVKLTNAFKKSLDERKALKKRNIQLTKKNKILISQFKELKSMFLVQINNQKKQSMLIDDLRTQALNQQTELKSQKAPEDEDVPVEQEFTMSDADDTMNDDDMMFSVQYIET